MSFTWTPHRFSGGALALDVANSVILRFDASARIDRFAVPEQLDAFAGAAETLSAEREDFGGLVPVAPKDAQGFIELRETIDAFFRQRVLDGRDDPLLEAELLGAIATTIRRHADVAYRARVSSPSSPRPSPTPPQNWEGLEAPNSRSTASPQMLSPLVGEMGGGPEGGSPTAFPCPVDLATARSALRLVCHPEPERLKICPECEWLFIDRSRNRSRSWCDMAVCGNRAKARLHYRRRKGGAP